MSDEDSYKSARDRLLEEIHQHARDTRRWTGRDRFSDRVMDAVARVPRHLFVPEEAVVAAYANRPQAIGFGQTISQPYIVAVMTELLDPGPGDRVLEVGTGSGYQTAILAELAAKVFSVEVIADLAAKARERLTGLGYANVAVREGDGWEGWPERAPFERIIVTAAPERIPQALIDQLKPGGRMVVPVGPLHDTQHLHLGRKDDEGIFRSEWVLPVAFVPMVHGRSGDA